MRALPTNLIKELLSKFGENVAAKFNGALLPKRNEGIASEI